MPLHKQYREYELSAKGKVSDLSEVIDIVRIYWSGARMEGSAGPARMFLNENRKFVAYTWGTRNWRNATMTWHFLVFEDEHEW